MFPKSGFVPKNIISLKEISIEARLTGPKDDLNPYLSYNVFGLPDPRSLSILAFSAADQLLLAVESAAAG